MARYQPAERHARFQKARKAGRTIILSEGDSWFDYPLCLNIIDLLDDERRFAIKRLEFSGDTVKNMIGSAGSFGGLNSLSEVVGHERPRFVLFSGGGNDIVGKELKDAIKTFDSTQSPEWHLDTPKWRSLKAGVEEGYRKLIKTIGPLAPVIAHGYDNIIPSDRPVRYDGIAVGGPWVFPEMERAEIPANMQIRIAKAMMEWFNNLLSELGDEFPALFAHIDLRGTLSPDDWGNEIHPSRSGFKLVFAEFLSQLDQQLTPLLAAHDEETLGVPG